MWKSVLKGDAEIDLTKVDTTRDMSEFDDETQGGVRKVMYDYQQKLQGKPTSDEQVPDKLCVCVLSARLALPKMSSFLCIDRCPCQALLLLVLPNLRWALESDVPLLVLPENAVNAGEGVGCRGIAVQRLAFRPVQGQYWRELIHATFSG